MKDDKRLVATSFTCTGQRKQASKEIFAVVCCTHSPDFGQLRLVACLSAAATEDATCRARNSPVDDPLSESFFGVHPSCTTEYRRK